MLAGVLVENSSINEAKVAIPALGAAGAKIRGIRLWISATISLVSVVIPAKVLHHL
jgi:hypothetical protein